MTNAEAPLVSIFSFCKDRKAMIARSIESVLDQSYRNIELVIQDGASSDGTLEIIQKYAQRDARVKLVSAPDSGHLEAFLKAFRRCEGEIIGSCLSDEELMPDAVARVVDVMRHRPGLGAVTGDGYTTDQAGRVTGDFITGEFDFVNYLFGRYCPLWAASFFRKAALKDVGLYEPGWGTFGVEFEVWCRLATRYEIQYLPERIAKYAIHDSQLSNTPRNILEHVDYRLALINELFSEKGFFGCNEILRVACVAAQLAQFADHALLYGLDEVLNGLESRRQREIGDPNAQALADLGYTGIHRIQSQTQRHWHKFATLMPLSMRRYIPRDLKDKIRLAFKDTLTNVRVRKEAARANEARRAGTPVAWESEIDPGIGKDPDSYRSVYPVIAQIYEARGQIGQVIEAGRRAEALNDVDFDSVVCQAMLKLPEASEATIAESQAHWAERHANRTREHGAPTFKYYDGKRKIRIGYNCEFMETPTIRAQAMGVIMNHPRTAFEVYGYSNGPVYSDMEAAFDKFRDTADLDDNAFVKRVREDEIDVFIEMTGYSIHHRFGAMAQRVAPVQISYLNHAGTCSIPEVDYIFADEIGIPTGSSMERHYSEAIHRIPGCFFVFDYESLGAPPVVDPPSRRNGYITFANFGSGGKINLQLIEWWASLLHRVPNSIFYIRNSQLNPPDNKTFMRERFARFGIGPERLRIEGGVQREALLRCYDDVDISLDTWPYCGGNSVAEALWQGVPVVSLLGDRFAARYGASLVTAAGLPDLVASTPEAYIDCAARLAGDADRLLQLRHDLRRMYKTHGLGDSKRLARAFEQAFVEMLARTQAGVVDQSKAASG